VWSGCCRHCNAHQVDRILLPDSRDLDWSLGTDDLLLGEGRHWPNVDIRRGLVRWDRRRELFGLRPHERSTERERETSSLSVRDARALCCRRLLRTAASTALTALPTFSVRSFQFGGGRSRKVFDRFAGGLYAILSGSFGERRSSRRQARVVCPAMCFPRVLPLSLTCSRDASHVKCTPATLCCDAAAPRRACQWRWGGRLPEQQATQEAAAKTSLHRSQSRHRSSRRGKCLCRHR
jgi:hypothetical protein